MEFAKRTDIDKIVEFYKNVIDEVNKTSIKLGWNIEIYPNYDFVENATNNNEMCIQKLNGEIVAVGVVNHTVNKEYDEIDWKIKQPKSKIATIHALATSPKLRGGSVSSQMLMDIEKYCKDQGDVAIHLDVIDTNVPAYKLYIRNGYELIEEVEMYYEVVGTRHFSMMEKIL